MATVSLAEPRRRQKWTLNPRGNLWANDEGKFGKKLMEKMGWEKGKGLGANLSGNVDHISLRHKDNNKGIGFEGHDDTWLAHQDDFQSVLAALNVEHGDAGKNLNEDEKKGKLEEISKKSRRRVHYQKFVRGKDSSNYSVEDLGCILGTKSDKVGKPKPEETPAASAGNTDEEQEAENKSKNFVSGGNYTDYFRQKMAALKAKGKFTAAPEQWLGGSSSSRVEEAGEEGASRGGLGSVSAMDNIKNNYLEKYTSDETEPADVSEVKEKKKKKKSKNSSNDEVRPACVENVVSDCLPDKKKKSKKLKKRKIESEQDDEEEIGTATGISEDVKVTEVNLPSEIADGEPLQKKRKKSKRDRAEKLDFEVLSPNQDTLPEVAEESSKEKKKKKSKKSKKEKENVLEDVIVEVDSGCDNSESKTKKNKKGKKEKNKKKNTSLDESMIKIQEIPLTDAHAVIAEKKAQLDFIGANLAAIPGYGIGPKK